MLRGGSIVQRGAPRDVYRRPATPFVAQFLGVANLLPGHADPAGRNFTTAKGLTLPATDAVPGAAFAAIREENVVVSPAGMGLRGTVSDVAFLGASTRVSVEVGGERIHGVAAGGQVFSKGDAASLSIHPTDVLLLPPEPA